MQQTHPAFGELAHCGSEPSIIHCEISHMTILPSTFAAVPVNMVLMILCVQHVHVYEHDR